MSETHIKTRLEVFIIESLNFADEKKSRFEGRILSEILALSDKRCTYYYIRTEAELRCLLREFTTSAYRYLHLSCHGSERSMFTTLDPIPFPKLAETLRPHIKSRRLFLSACSMANENLAKLLMPGSGCYSIMGPSQDILFNDAAVLWASLYHTMFAWETSGMVGKILRRQARAVAEMYQVRLQYFGRDRTKRKGYFPMSFVPEGRTILST
jgi:hypothetical protein